MARAGKIRCGNQPCPECDTPSPCFDHLSVDVGVGEITGEHLYLCPRHGEFSERGEFRYPEQIWRCPECDAREVNHIAAEDRANELAKPRVLQALAGVLRNVRDTKSLYGMSVPPKNEKSRPLVQLTVVIDAMEYERLKLMIKEIE